MSLAYAAGEFVVQVRATDSHSTANVSYRIEGEEAVLFCISYEGLITSTLPLDRENESSHRLIVVASDMFY